MILDIIHHFSKAAGATKEQYIPKDLEGDGVWLPDSVMGCVALVAHLGHCMV